MIVGIVIAVVAALFALMRFVLIPNASPRPENLGVDDGQFAACPRSPNCVSSQADESDNTHYIDPLPMRDTVDATRQALVSIIEELPRSEVITSDENYIHAEFRSLTMGFIDDAEFYIDPNANVVHVRSAARLGEGDMGVNRRRIETIREQYTQ